jgi:hypothetical protein
VQILSEERTTKVTINFSHRALVNKEKGSLIALCDNDCGAWIYYDIQTKTIRNAEVHKKDSLHWETCSTLKRTWMIASAMNWFPSYSFINQARAFIDHAKQMYDLAITLESGLNIREQINKDCKVQWDEEKKKKTQEKKMKRLNYN